MPMLASVGVTVAARTEAEMRRRPSASRCVVAPAVTGFSALPSAELFEPPDRDSGTNGSLMP
eukprot:scaffold217928_cov48-Prasinocladus_malaysianus.AAC.1